MVLVVLFVNCMSSLRSIAIVLAVSGCMHEFPVKQSCCSLEYMYFDEYRVGKCSVYALLPLKCINSCMCMLIQCIKMNKSV